MSATEAKIPGPDHPITIEPHRGRVVVRAGERVIADTTDALELREASYPVVLYVPLSDLDEDSLERTETTSWCPYKGTASYFTVRAGDEVLEDVIWYYAEPHDAVSEIGGHAAFYANRVSIES